MSQAASSSPMSSSTPVEASGASPAALASLRDGQVVKDAYFKYTDIVFEWSKSLPPYQVSCFIHHSCPLNTQANAVSALVKGEGTCHPEHPLHVDDVEGVSLYLGMAPFLAGLGH